METMTITTENKMMMSLFKSWLCCKENNALEFIEYQTGHTGENGTRRILIQHKDNRSHIFSYDTSEGDTVCPGCYELNGCVCSEEEIDKIKK